MHIYTPIYILYTCIGRVCLPRVRRVNFAYPGKELFAKNAAEVARTNNFFIA